MTTLAQKFSINSQVLTHPFPLASCLGYRMASFLHLFHIFFLISTSYFLVTQSKPPQHTAFNPNKLVLPIQKDQATHLFITNIHKRTPLKQVPFVVHLNGQFLWVACEQSYLSSTYHAPLCHSTQCARANTPYCHTCNSTPRPGCHNNTCGLMATNPMTHQAAMAELLKMCSQFNPQKAQNLDL